MSTSRQKEPSVLFQFSLSPSKLLTTLAVGAVILVGLSTVGHTIDFFYELPPSANVARIFNLGGEANVASWYSSLLLSTAAALLFYLATASEGQHRKRWWWLGVVFIFLSLDETALLHDVTLELPMIEWLQPTGIFSFPWVIVGWLFVLLLAIPYWPFINKLPKQTFRQFILAACLYVGGALGLEMYSAWLFDLHLDALVLRGGISTIQEMAELSGVLLFIYAILQYIPQISDHIEPE